MTPTECVSLVRLIDAYCPSMRLNDATPDAWYIHLVNVDATDAREAVVHLAGRQSYIALHELLAEAALIERRRAGAQRVAELQAQIEAENPPAELAARPLHALEVGKPLPPETPEERASRRAMLRQAAHTKREAPAVEVAERAEDDARRAQAHAELAALTAQNAATEETA